MCADVICPRYVHTFVQQVELDKQRKHAAANVIKQAFQIVHLMRAGQTSSSRLLLRHRARLLHALRAMHEAQFLKTALSEFTVGTVEVNSGVNDMQDTVTAIQNEQRDLGQRVANLETLMLAVSRQVNEIRDLLKDKSV